MPQTLALAGGSFVFLAVVVVLFFGMVFGLYTRRGSGIDEHPNDGLDGAPGAKQPDAPSGAGTLEGHDDGPDPFATHGTA